tara:strand:- start:12303 stop:13256 length:954 start_codon:yes stop_codon:yes gene_type:complete
MKNFWPIVKIFALIAVALSLLICILFGYSDIPTEELKLKYAQKPSSFASINGIDTHFRDEGNKTDSIPIVLIHGTGASLHTFDEWTNGLKQDFRVVRMDLPGYGLTNPFINHDYSINHYVEFINAFLEKQKIKRCIIGGNSLGGHIAWQYALQHPQKVDRLILIDAGGFPSRSKSTPIAFKLAKIPLIKNLFKYITPKFVVRSSVENVYANPEKISEELIKRYFELSLREGNRQAFIDRFKKQKSSSSHEHISKIIQETLILWGEKDFLIPVDNAYLFEKKLPNSTLVLFKNLGHVPMEEDAEQSLAPVLNFLAQKN